MKKIIFVIIFCGIQINFINWMIIEHSLAQWMTTSPQTSIFIMDILEPRLAVVRTDDNSFTIWNFDSEKQSFLSVPKGFIHHNEHEHILAFVPIEHNHNKIGIIKNVHTTACNQYIICSYDDTIIQEHFSSPNDLYTSFYLVRLNNQNCLCLCKKDRTFDIRLSKDFSIISSNNEKTIPLIEEIAFTRYLSNNLFIISKLWPQEVNIWDCIERKNITSFQGFPTFPQVAAVDSSEENGVFLTRSDFVTTKNEISVYPCLQIISLRTGKMRSQITFPHIGGAKFSPTTPDVILIWSEKTAVLWKYESLGHGRGEILSSMKLPSYSPILNQGNKNNGCKNNSIFYGTFSSDGKRIIFITDDLRIYIYSSDTGKLLRCDTIRKPIVNSSNE